MTMQSTLASSILALPRPLLLALDVDGTLAPIVLDPSEARVPEATLALLSQLSEKLHVALVTGRDNESLERMIGPLGRLVWRAGEHGRLVLPPGQAACEEPLDEASRARLDAFADWIATTPGRLERKARSVALHVRGVPDAERWLQAARDCARALQLYARDGRQVVEAAVEEADKARALAHLHGELRTQSIVYAGDDLTDLPAIAFAARHGIGVYVQSEERPNPPTCATALPNVHAVGELLEKLSAAL